MQIVQSAPLNFEMQQISHCQTFTVIGSYYGSFSGLRNSHLVAMIWSDHSDEAETQIEVRSKVARTTRSRKIRDMADEL
ncbi:unnamed protein product [Camellia sinensis]